MEEEKGEEEENVSVKIEDPVGELRRYFYPISRVRACSSSSSTSSCFTPPFTSPFTFDVTFAFSRDDAQRLVICTRACRALRLLPYAF